MSPGEPTPAGRRVVVLTGTAADADALGATARALEDAGHRTVVFVGDVTAEDDRTALLELLAELFPDS
jgi:NAD(P)-dependent dehydrogenase (short-subunit alcohol dehydrogenase family)